MNFYLVSLGDIAANSETTGNFAHAIIRWKTNFGKNKRGA